ncbi:MAG TPA: PPOX class F420-dependent oxidoreductase [Gaiellales bacterium]|nr:PPOX class F420-dependent oxidoreductase [Gaiellales bacterium]
MIELPPPAVELLRGRNLAHLATLNRDGSVQVTPVWVDVEDGEAVFNTAEGRVKWRNMRRDPRITIEVTDHSDPDRYVMIRGRAEMTRDGANEHIERLSWKYDGAPFASYEEGVARVKVYVHADQVHIGQ